MYRPAVSLGRMIFTTWDTQINTFLSKHCSTTVCFSRRIHHLSIQDREALKAPHRRSSWTFADSPALVSARNIVPRDLHTEFWVTVYPWVYWLRSRKAVLMMLHSASFLLTQFTIQSTVSQWSRIMCFWGTCLNKITFASLHTQLLL